jgi:hypothetical protein
MIATLTLSASPMKNAWSQHGLSTLNMLLKNADKSAVLTLTVCRIIASPVPQPIMKTYRGFQLVTTACFGMINAHQGQRVLEARV